MTQNNLYMEDDDMRLYVDVQPLYIDELENSKNTAVQCAAAAAQSAEYARAWKNDIIDYKTNLELFYAQASNGLTNQYDNTVANINSTKNSAISDLQTQKNTLLNNLNSFSQSALNTIRQNGQSYVNQAKDYAEQAQNTVDNRVSLDHLNQSKALETGNISTDSDILADIKKYAHSTFDRSKFTVVGSPNITDDGVASGFSTSNFIRALSNNKISHTGHTVEYCYKNLNIVLLTGFPYFCTVRCTTTADSYINLAFGVRVSTGDLIIVGTGSDGNNIYIVMPFATFYQNPFDFKISFNGTTLSLSIYQNGELKSSKSTTLLATPLDSYIQLGNQQYNNSSERYNAWQSSIDLKQFSITVDGVEVFSGNKTGIDTIKPDNYTVVGTPTISTDGIASEFSSSNNINVPTINVAGKNFEIDLGKITTPSDVTSAQYIVGGQSLTQDVISVEIANNYIYLASYGIYFATITGLRVQANTDYYIKCGVENNKAYLKLSTNGKDYTTYTQALTTNYSTLMLKIGSAPNTGAWSGSIDLNSVKIYADGNLVYQPCLKIPYTQSKTGSKIVQSVYRDRVTDMYEQFGYATYYTLSDTDFTLPMGEIYGMIEKLRQLIIDRTTA